MSTVRANTILDAAGGTTATVNGYTPTASNMAGRNKIINGDMRIDQRNAYAVIGTTAGQEKYIADRWVVNIQGANSSAQCSNDSAGLTTGFQRNLKLSGAAGVTNMSVIQRIEAANAASLAGKTITVSAWIWQDSGSAVTGAMFVAASPTTTADTFSALTQNGSTAGIASIANGGVMVRYSGQITLDSNASKGVQINFNLNTAMGAGKTLYVTGFQVEEGSTATPFENRPYDTELALCRRYCQTIGSTFSGMTEGTTAFAIAVPYIFPMRASATVSTRTGYLYNARYYGSDISITNPTVANVTSSPTGVWLQVAGSGLVSNAPISGRYQSGDLALFLLVSAEL